MKVMSTDDVSWPATRKLLAAVSPQAGEAAHEVVGRRRLAPLQPGPLLPERRLEHPPRPRARPEAPAERRERQVQRHRPHALQHLGERRGEPLPDGAALEAEEQRRDDAEREQLHQRQHGDGPAPRPLGVEVPRHLGVDRAHVPPQHVGLEELHHGAAHAAVVVADELEDVPAAQDQRQAPGLLRRQRVAAEHQLVRGGPRHEHRGRAEQRQPRHGAVPADPVPQPPLAGVAPHRAEQAQALPDHRQAQRPRWQLRRQRLPRSCR